MINKISKVFICFFIFILMINISSPKVYGKDFIDYVDSLLTHPISTISGWIIGEDKVQFVKNFEEYPVETVGCFVIDILKSIFGEIPQIFANKICSDLNEIDYSTETIEKTQYLNEYVKLDDYIEHDPNYKCEINIGEISGAEEGDQYRKFSSKTPIPIIAVDLDNMASGDIDIMDINFISPRKIHNKDSLWMILRNFAVTIIRIIFYLGVGFYIIMIIYHAIKIITNSLSNPNIKKEHLEGLKRLAVSLVMLIGTIIIMSVTIYGIKMLYNQLNVNNGNELPIRVHVKGAGYSFSTNITGYVRYMSSMEGVTNVIQKGIYAFIYIVMAIVNFVMTIVMVMRMIIMLLLAILGPISAIMYSINVQKPMKYEQWVKVYLCFAIIQIFVIVAYRVFIALITN